MKKYSRRAVLAAGGSLLTRQLLPQSTEPVAGSASRGVQAQPRSKPSGIPFLAQFTDIAAKAGLTHPVIFGPTDHADYILEGTGCGVAFFDYDNDGWLDILVLNGSRLDTAAIPPGVTNRLYKNNRNGTFSDVTEKAGLIRSGWAQAVTIGDYNNDGHEDIFITYYGQNVLYRNNGDGTFTDVTKGAGLLQEGVHWGSGCTFIITTKTAFSISSSATMWISTWPKSAGQAQTGAAPTRRFPCSADPVASPRPASLSTRTTATAHFTMPPLKRSASWKDATVSQ